MRVWTNSVMGVWFHCTDAPYLRINLVLIATTISICVLAVWAPSIQSKLQCVDWKMVTTENHIFEILNFHITLWFGGAIHQTFKRWKRGTHSLNYLQIFVTTSKKEKYYSMFKPKQFFFTHSTSKCFAQWICENKAHRFDRIGFYGTIL